MFNRRNANAAPPSFPEGWNDPDSEFYIPEPFRDRWFTVEPTERAIASARPDVLNSIAHERAVNVQQAEFTAGRGTMLNQGRHGEFTLDERDSNQDSPRNIARRIEQTERDYVAALTRHRVRIQLLTQIDADADRHAMNDAADSAARTCPKCGKYIRHEGTGMRIRDRELIGLPPEKADRSHNYDSAIRSCADCYIVAAHALAATAGAEEINGKTRRQRIAEWLAS